MRKTLVLSVGALLLLSSCGTYTAEGAYTGGTFGSIIGSAIGGITGGPRGSDVGTLIGMAGGAAVGAVIGAAADDAQQRRYEDYRAARRQRHQEPRPDQRRYDDGYTDESGFDSTNSGDDRLYGFGEDLSSTVTPANTSVLEIRHARVIDKNRDGVLNRGEEAMVVFEVFNTSSETVYRVQPSVAEVTGNRHIRISENVLVESIRPGKGIRYTAVLKADDRLRDGDAVIRVGVFQGNREVNSQTQEFTIKTSRR